jgi:hypothetical protein
MEVGMLDRLVEIFCAMDDFCKAFFLQWAALQLSAGKAWERGPECGLSESEIKGARQIRVILYANHLPS